MAKIRPPVPDPALLGAGRGRCAILLQATGAGVVISSASHFFDVDTLVDCHQFGDSTNILIVIILNVHQVLSS